jgi:hypothetical protein
VGKIRQISIESLPQSLYTGWVGAKEALVFWKRLVLFCIAIIGMFWLSGCDSSSSPSVAVLATNSANISVTSVDGTDAVKLTATVKNDKSTSGTPDGVTWNVTVTSSSCSASGSTTTCTATYTAPAATTSAQTINITAISVANTSKTGSLTLTVPAKLANDTIQTGSTITTALTITVGTVFSQHLAVTGGISPYVWNPTLVSGSLPAGWTISSTGVLSCSTSPCVNGAPSASQVAGSPYSFTVQVTDSGDSTVGTATKETLNIPLTLTINAAPAISFYGTMPATASYNVAYTGSAAASGGAGALSYQVTTGSLPTGFNPINSSTGAVTGKPTANGPFNFTVQAADAYGDLNTQAYTITVSYAALTLPTGTASIPGGVETGQSYSGSITASGGSGNYSWTVTGLPSGLTYNSTGNPLVISGTAPSTTQTIPITVIVTDTTTSDTAGTTDDYSIVVAAYGAHNSYLKGTYVCKSDGFDDGTGARWSSLSSVVADGNGNFTTGGFYDTNSRDLIGGEISGAYTGTYSIGADNNGTANMVATVPSSPNANSTWAIAITGGSPTVPAQEFRKVRADDAGGTPSNTHGGGVCYLATTSAFAASTISGKSFAFGVQGETSSGVPKAYVGRFTDSTESATGGTGSAAGGSISSGSMDGMNLSASGDNNTVDGPLPFSGSYTTPGSSSSSTPGRFTVAFAPTGSSDSMNFAVYIIDADRMFVLSTDIADSSTNVTDGLVSGDVRIQQQTANTKAVLLDNSAVLYSVAYDGYSGGSVTGYDTSVFQISGDGSGTLTVHESYENDGGDYKAGNANNQQVSIALDGTYAGRATFTPPSGSGISDSAYLYFFNASDAFYLELNGSNSYLETGWLEAQTATSADFTDTAMAGTYMMGDMSALSSGQNNHAGEITVASSGDVTANTTTAGEGEYSFDQEQTGMTVSWLSTTYGTFSVANGATAEESCAVISTTKIVCTDSSDISTPKIQILQQ